MNTWTRIIFIVGMIAAIFAVIVKVSVWIIRELFVLALIFVVIVILLQIFPSIP